MTNTKSDKPLALRTSIICAIIIAAVFTLIGSLSTQLPIMWNHGSFKVAVTILSIAFIIASVLAYKLADDGEYDNKTTGAVVLITVIFILLPVICMVVGNEKVAPGSPQMEDIR